MLEVQIEANSSVADARLVATESCPKIEFNPQQPRERVRFSIAHEIAHLLYGPGMQCVKRGIQWAFAVSSLLSIFPAHHGPGMRRSPSSVVTQWIAKPSEKTPLVQLAVQKICERAVARFGPDAPDGLIQVLIGGLELGEALPASRKVTIMSATGSVPMGKAVASDMSRRLGKTTLELCGNNAMIVAPSADLEMALRAIVFSAVGTTGQRCTSLRRLMVHEVFTTSWCHGWSVPTEPCP